MFEDLSDTQVRGRTLTDDRQSGAGYEYIIGHLCASAVSMIFLLGFIPISTGCPGLRIMISP
jgi:hypothetical protein